jgi:hypothetical protein
LGRGGPGYADQLAHQVYYFNKTQCTVKCRSLFCLVWVICVFRKCRLLEILTAQKLCMYVFPSFSLNVTFIGPCIIIIFEYISNKMQRYTVLFYLENAVHVSGGTSTDHQECIQLYLQCLVFVTLLLLPAAVVACSSNGVTNTRRCRYSCISSWWWVEIPPKTCRAVSRYK